MTETIFPPLFVHCLSVSEHISLLNHSAVSRQPGEITWLVMDGNNNRLDFWNAAFCVCVDETKKKIAAPFILYHFGQRSYLLPINKLACLHSVCMSTM